MKTTTSIANLANTVVDMTLLGMDYTTQAHAMASAIATVEQDNGVVFNSAYRHYIITQVEQQS